MNRQSDLSFRILALIAASALITPAPVEACSSCGCSLSSDWEAQGLSSGQGFRVDLRFDAFDQDQLRTGDGKVDTGSITFPTDREIQQETRNRNTTLTLDYNTGSRWAVVGQIPYYDRFHTTITENETDVSTSHTKSIGDARVTARYQGIFGDHATGLLFGLKLPTGSHDETFSSGPEAGEILDRGLQPGTGTTDIAAGIYHFGSLPRSWSYFVQALVQTPLGSSDGFRPGTGLNVNGGLRYREQAAVSPQVQMNVRSEGREEGPSADVENSGGTLVYVSPGLSVKLGSKVRGYGFVGVPVFQRVNGYQLEPRVLFSIGVHASF